MKVGPVNSLCQTDELSSPPDSSSFLPVPLTTLAVSRKLCVDLYIKPSNNQPPVLYRERRYPTSPDDFDRLAEQGVRLAYIPASQLGDYQRHLRSNLDDHLADEDIPATDRYAFLSEAGRDLLAECTCVENVEILVRTASSLGNQMVELIASHEMACWDLFSILRHDYRTYTHSFNVASYSLLLAKALGIRDEEELKEIALGGLLHDTGKLRIPSTLLCKKGRLTQAERVVIERHATDGFVQLSDRGDFSWGQLMMVYQHHERLDGSGYPVGKSGDEIHYLARLCAVVDVFEALTSRRPYRNPMLISEAFDFLGGAAGIGFDQEMVRCWNERINRRP